MIAPRGAEVVSSFYGNVTKLRWLKLMRLFYTNTWQTSTWLKICKNVVCYIIFPIDSILDRFTKMGSLHCEKIIPPRIKTTRRVKKTCIWRLVLLKPYFEVLRPGTCDYITTHRCYGCEGRVETRPDGNSRPLLVWFSCERLVTYIGQSQSWIATDEVIA